MRRRQVLQGLAGTGGVLLTGGVISPLMASAAAMPRTPAQNEGPYYPLEKPKDRDANLLRIGAGGQRAFGDPLNLSGRVLVRDGKPLAGAVVEIWQADHQGNYKHPYAPGREELDVRFQGYGEMQTDAAGRYEFLTIVPVRYGFRTPHIHVKVKRPGMDTLTTQIYLRDHPENRRDNLLNHLSDSERDRLMMDLSPATLAGGLKGKKTRFDFVV